MNLIFSVIFLTEPEDSVAKSEDVFVGGVARIREFFNLQQRSVAIGCLDEGSLKNPEIVFLMNF